MALNKALQAKTRAEEEAAEAAAAIQASELKAAQYKKENLGLLSDYDAWISSLINRKGTTSLTSTANSSGTLMSSGAEVLSAAAKARAALALSGSGGAAAAVAGAAAGGLASARSTSTSPGRSNLAGLLKRSLSGAVGVGGQEGSGGGAGWGPGTAGSASFKMSGTLDDKAQAAADLERYDKIAALIDSRTKGRSGGGVNGGSLGRALSSRDASGTAARQASFR